MADTSYRLLINGSPAAQELIDAIAQIEVEDDAGLASAFRLRLPIGLTADGDWTWVAEDIFKPLTPVAISVRVGTATEQIISGYVTTHRIHFDDSPGASFFEVAGMDAGTLLNLEEKVVAWKNMADSDVASQIFAARDFDAKVDSTQPSYSENDVTIIQRGSDLAFLRRLARRNGFEFFFESDPTTGKVTGHFHKPDLSGQPQRDLALAFGEGRNVKTLEANYDALRPRIAEAYGVALADKSEQSASSTSTSLDPLGATAVLDELSQQPKALLARAGAFENAELQARAQAVVDTSSWAISLSGEVDVTAYQAVLRARRSVLIKGAGSRYSGTYYVASVLHTLTRDSYSQKFQLQRNAHGLKGGEPFGAGAGLALSLSI